MTPDRRAAILAGLKRQKDRELAIAHPDRLHPCVWLVEDGNGPLQMGGRPRLPVGMEWPRIDGKPLAYLLAIPLAMLPEWVALPRTGDLLLFVGLWQCRVVIVAADAATQELAPPDEDYLGGEPERGELLKAMRFRLEEGLHVGLSASSSAWGTERQEQIDPEVDSALDELGDALTPSGSVGRLFGHYEAWVGVDAAEVVRMAYLYAHGHGEGMYADLDQPIQKLEKELREAERVPAPVTEALPEVGRGMVEAVQRQVRAAEEAVTLRQGKTKPAEKQAVEDSGRELAKWKKRWERAGADAHESGYSLGRLLDAALGAMAKMEEIPPTDDPQVREATERANREREQKLQQEVAELTQAANNVMAQMTRMFSGQGGKPGDLKAALGAAASRPSEEEIQKALRSLRDELDTAERRSNYDALRDAWRKVDAFMNEHALDMPPWRVSWWLSDRLRVHRNLQAIAFRGYKDPKQIAANIATLRWWQADKARHVTEMVHWRPLFVLRSSRTPYFWGDAGHCIILADERQIATGNLGRLAGVVDVS